MNNISSFLTDSKNKKDVHKPIILRLDNSRDKATLSKLLEDSKVTFVCDEIYGQLQELIKSLNPSAIISQDEYPELINKHLAEKIFRNMGCGFITHGANGWYTCWMKKSLL